MEIEDLFKTADEETFKLPIPVGKEVIYEFNLNNKKLSERRFRNIINDQRTALNNFFDIEINNPGISFVSHQIDIYKNNRWPLRGWWMKGASFPYMEEGKITLTWTKREWKGLFSKVNKEYRKEHHSPTNIEICLKGYSDSLIVEVDGNTNI